MATITIVQGRGSHPAEAASSGGAVGALVELDTGENANSWSGAKGDRLFVYNDAASTADTISVVVDGTTNVYGAQPDKGRYEITGGQVVQFDFDALEGWVPDGGTLIYVTIEQTGTASAKAFVSRPAG